MSQNKFKRDGSYINSPEWIKNKKAAIHPINKKNNKSFQYAVTVTSNPEEIIKGPKRITNIKPYTDEDNWEGINYPSGKDDWKKIEKNNLTMSLNVLHGKKEKIYPAHLSKHNSNREKQVICLIITNG